MVIGGGCLMTMGPGEPMATQAEVAYLRGEVQRLRGEQEAVVGEVGRLRGEVQAVASSQGAHATRGEVRALEARVGGVEAQLRKEAEARAKGEKQIYDDIVGKVTELAKKQAAAAPKGRRSYGSGWEHEVRAGESLSVIAGAYQSSVGAIMKANGIRNPDTIRVGQKLFIPDN